MAPVGFWVAGACSKAKGFWTKGVWRGRGSRGLACSAKAEGLCVCEQEIPLRSNVYEVYATDKDEGLNGVVLYNLLKTGAGNKDWEYFSIDSVSGLIQTAMRLDREKQAVYNVSQAVCKGCGGDGVSWHSCGDVTA